MTDIVLFVRHPDGKGAGERSDYYASTHDVAPTVLGFLGVEPSQELDGQDLCAIPEDGAVQARPHFTLGYHDHVFTRNEEHAMMCRNDGTEARLYDLKRDPGMHDDIAGKEPGIVRRMFRDYVLEDAGGSLPTY